MIQLLANVHSHSSTCRQLHVFISYLQLLKSATLTWSLWSDWERTRLEQLTGRVAGSQSTSWCPFVEDAYLVSRRWGWWFKLGSDLSTSKMLLAFIIWRRLATSLSAKLFAWDSCPCIPLSHSREVDEVWYWLKHILHAHWVTLYHHSSHRLLVVVLLHSVYMKIVICCY